MTKRIDTTIQACSTSDLSFEWKIAAIRANLGWNWCGTLGAESRKLIEGAFPQPGESPTISCVTGRDASGQEVLYVRIYPQHLRRPVPEQSFSSAGWRRF